MKKSNSILFLILSVFCWSSYANTSVVDVWTCKLNDNKTMKDVAALNEKWVKFMNAQVKGGGINSYDLAPLVGSRESFMFVDVYPDLKTWAASEKAMESNDEGKKLQKEFKTLAKCSNNSLYKSTKH